ncbi:hypothetical protein ScPMuIL_017214, partial [Solemya velum]
RFHKFTHDGSTLDGVDENNIRLLQCDSAEEHSRSVFQNETRQESTSVAFWDLSSSP